ncbi:MAG TPA: LuxR C-terminal-related transcriptional regulator [Candidatus Sulfotelmatobacter sp.]|nr:LuxR C-terminal-related transcriptional regulator [Candidatus Sulfotelmatobacter sp.]
MTPNLTRREREVAILVGQGLTNREIAVRLFISERTAESHVEQIRGKLGVRSRAQIAVWVAAGGLTGSGPPPASVSPARETPPPTLDRPQIRLQGRRAVIVSTALAGIAVLALLAVWLSWLSAPHATQSLGTTVAGTGERAFSSDGGQATASSLVRPLAVAVGPSGEIYIAEDSRIREVNKDGRISTFAGTGTSGYSGDLAPAAQAQLNMPQGLAVDSAGNVYISDTLNDRVRRVDADGTITTVAGTGVAGYAGDGGPGREATLNLPTGLAIGFNDALFIADTGNNVVRQLGPDGIIRTVAGTGEAGYRGDGGPADYAVLHSPGGVAFDAEGNLYIADSLNQRVRRVDVNGQIATVAGTGTAGYAGDGGPAVYAELHMATNPLEGMGQGLAVDSQGDVFIADATNHRVRRVDVSGNIRTVVQMDTPLGLAVDPRGAVYVADADDNRVRRVG